MFSKTPHQLHGAYQRRDRLSLEVSERELMGRSSIDQTQTRHVPYLSVDSALGSRASKMSPCSDSQYQSVSVQPSITLVPQCDSLPAMVEVNPLLQRHTRNIQQSLARRIRTAYEQSDQALVCLLQQEAAQFA